MPFRLTIRNLVPTNSCKASIPTDDSNFEHLTLHVHVHVQDITKKTQARTQTQLGLLIVE